MQIHKQAHHPMVGIVACGVIQDLKEEHNAGCGQRGGGGHRPGYVHAEYSRSITTLGLDQGGWGNGVQWSIAL